MLKRFISIKPDTRLPCEALTCPDSRAVRRWVLAVLLAFMALPLCVQIWAGNSDRFFYLYVAIAYLVSVAFCLAAARRWRSERRRWQILAASLALHVLVYVDASLRDSHLLSYAVRAWFGNIVIAAAAALMLPALLSTRLDRGKLLRALDTSLVLVFAVVLMFSLGSGELAGDSNQRKWISILALALLSVLALIARFAQASTGTRHFINVVSKTVWTDLLTSLLVNWICLRWFPNAPNAVLAPLAALQALLLCYWTVQSFVPDALSWFSLNRIAIDALQPSVLTLSSVVLTLFTFHTRSLLACGLVVAVVLLYAVRTQMFYTRLFREQHMLRSQTEYLHELATRDPLTGIANRRWLEETVVRFLQDHTAYPCSLLMVDTDRFKEINDTHGHQAGDSVLCMIADVLQRETDGIGSTCVGRIGGDEFAVLLPRLEENQALQCAERIRDGVEQLGISRGYGVTASIGLATLTIPASRSELLQAADEALYRAKAAGRNAVQV